MALLRLSAALLLLGQLSFIGVTQLHAGGDANDHPAVFVGYAASGNWEPVHVGQFASIAALLAGLLVLFFALDTEAGRATWMSRVGAALAVTALALYGALQAVDGVALKQAVNAWASAPQAEQAARFASAEAVRWLERGMRSYHDFALGLALLMVATATVRRHWIPRPIPYLAGLTGLVYLAQGWVLESEAFSPTHTILILLAWVLALAWMSWLVVVAWRMPGAGAPSPAR